MVVTFGVDCRHGLTALFSAGITSLLINGRPVPLTSALMAAEDALMGDYAASWPLTKVLDIGGSEKSPNYTEKACSSE